MTAKEKEQVYRQFKTFIKSLCNGEYKQEYTEGVFCIKW